MPKSSPPQAIYCQQADDFTVVTTNAECNKENLSQARNYQTLSQTIALERLQLVRMIELENSIFTEAFHLIEIYYRPTNSTPNATDPSEESRSQVSMQAKRKRRSKNEPKEKHLTSESHHGLGAIQLPRKRVRGLSKAYKTEYSAKMSLPGISKHFANFYHDLIDWQLVFASATEFPTNGNNLAKELNYDSLFDYEDAIASIANLLSSARQHSDLIDGLVLQSESECKSVLPEYARDQTNYGGSAQFRKMIALVEQLIEHKKNRLEQLRLMVQQSDHNSTNLLSNWFKGDKSQTQGKEVYGQEQSLQAYQHIQQLVKEVSAWEEFVDVVEISTP